MYVWHRQCFVSTSRACGIQGDSWTWWTCSTAFPSEVTALAVVALVVVVVLVVLVAAIHTLTARKAANSIAAYLKTRISLRISSSRPSSSQVNSMCMYVCMYFVNHMYVCICVCMQCGYLYAFMYMYKNVYMGMKKCMSWHGIAYYKWVIMYVCMYGSPPCFGYFRETGLRWQQRGGSIRHPLRRTQQKESRKSCRRKVFTILLIHTYIHTRTINK